MQISSGWAKGLRLAAPRGDATRPTAAKVRAAALNMLLPVLGGGRFLDLFAGSGGMGLEAVSRGAAAAVFVEQAAPALAALRQNIAEMERRARAQDLSVPSLQVVAGSLPAVLSRSAGGGKAASFLATSFDVIFIDPPYRQVASLAEPLLQALAGSSEQGVVLLFESATSEGELVAAAAAAAGWSLQKQRSYGETLLNMLEKS